MEESHFNSSYFWSPISTVPGQVGLNNASAFMWRKIYIILEEHLWLSKPTPSPMADRECHVPEQDERAARQECFLPDFLSIPLPDSCSHHPYIWDKDGWKRTGWNRSASPPFS